MALVVFGYVQWGGGDAEVSGSPTEKAILQWGLGMNFDAIRSNCSIIHVFPFNSEKKRGGIALKLPDAEVHIHWKGAAEIVLASCTRYIDMDGNFIPMDEDKVTLFKEDIEDMGARSLRCIAIAYRSYEIKNVPTDDEELAHWEIPENDLVLLAIVGLKDPCRSGVKDAVQLCTKAGVKVVYLTKHVLVLFFMKCGLSMFKDFESIYHQEENSHFNLGGKGQPFDVLVKSVRMVTGDNLQTARAIAVECGILGSDADATEPNVIEGKVFRALSEVERQEFADKISVMGRSSPNDKLLLVQALRKKGHVVAVTGDGTNDAPALHECRLLGSTDTPPEATYQCRTLRTRVGHVLDTPRGADIGLAMGIQGTEVAKESSDIIILDDNFASVVKVVRWGRSVYANIQKFIQFQLTVNVAALVINVVAAISSGEVPLNAVQLLWVNLIMDTLGALALATEAPTDHLMHRTPVGRRLD
ncbi:autoinhibited Ca(2+)-ATPase 9 [Actinidia rufa]|uniref:Autoinhibited Ca(2+)-ATPase 9 n=1 Tax=Actinidia rufa TaxID=165716 RepID=A0A7J0E1Y7_9ERIC|nr:autoinhibited Ca(2+)-ATPase 9 [Actinidia rufa]